jgi:metallo-beta-lactamase family protein
LQIETSKSEKVNVLFSGDLGNDMSRYLSEPDPAPKADYVFVEGTYGDYSRDFTIEEEYRRFIKEIGSTLSDGGIVWIPAFALDRSQRILHELESAINKGDLQGVSNIYLPSAAARKITKLYIDNPKWHDADVSTALEKIYSSVVKEYLDLDDFTPKPGSIIITTSGMMDSAYSVGLIPHLLHRTDLLIAFVGYQNPFTYGGQLRGGADSVVVDDAEIIKRAKTSIFSCFSGHGDADDIDRWLYHNMQSKIFLVHGEKDSLERRSDDLNRKGFNDVTVVRPLTKYELK